MCWSIDGLSCRQIYVSVAGCLGYDVLDVIHRRAIQSICVSVAGCLGYDVLGTCEQCNRIRQAVSVAGCLGYDVLVKPVALTIMRLFCFSCWLFRL